MTEITMPKLGESVTEGTIENWLVEVGDHVSEYDPICEVNTAKVTAEVPSIYDGVITEILVDVGETVPVGQAIYKIKRDDDNQGSDSVEDNTEVDETPSKETKQSPVKDNVKTNKRLSPVVMRLISEHNLNVDDIEGSGFEGRITKKDVEKYLENPRPQENLEEKSSPRETSIVQEETIKSGQDIKVNGVRKEIARRMVQAKTEIPHAWLMVEVDATNLVNKRNKHKEKFKEQEGVSLSYFSYIVKIVSEVMKDYPLLNSSWNEDTITVHDDINLSIAVANEDKLFVPVIKNADERSLSGIAKSIDGLVKKARSNKLTSDDMSGGT